MRGIFKKKELLFVVLLLVAGLFLRAYDLGSQSLWIDEAYSTTAALGVLEHGYPQMPSGEPYSRAPLHTYSVAASFALFGVGEASARLPAVVFGVFTIAIAYLLAKELLGRDVALLTAFFVTFSAAEIAFSRQARMYQFLQFFYLLSLLLFWRFQKEPGWRGLGLVCASTLLAIFSHSLGFSLLVVYALFLMATRWRSAAHGKIEAPVLGLLGFVAVSVVFAEYQYHAVGRVLGTGVDYFWNYWAFMKQALPVAFLLSWPGAIIALKEKRGEALLLLLGVLVPAYFVVFHEKMVGLRYLYLFFPIVLILFSELLVFFAGLAGECALAVRKMGGHVASARVSHVLVAFLVALALLAPGYSFFPRSQHFLEPMAPQPEFNSVYSFLQENAGPGDTIIVSYPEVALWHNVTPDYWLAFSISGFPNGTWLENGSYERTGTPAITGLEGLEAVHSGSTTGYIVLDSLSGSRIPPSYWEFLRNNTEWLTGPSKPGAAGGINLYGWDNSI
ncbi:MAG: glycosyltransferase family 39 protein [Candidatus Diapherotrites archaeon]|nr:glycosyltransferase family 39 protein [Candidatus Diapherotrites archaeon]